MFWQQLKWQVRILQKNNIIGLSMAVTLIYGLVFWLLRNAAAVDAVLVTLVLNDPAVIGYFFLALALYTERKQEVLSALFVTPLNPRTFIITRTLALSGLGTLCALMLSLAVKGVHFNLAVFALGTFFICVISTLLSFFMVTRADEFLRFAVISIPVFMPLTTLPLLHYLEILDWGAFQYLLPLQGPVNALGWSLGGSPINLWASGANGLIYLAISYKLAQQAFLQKMIQR